MSNDDREDRDHGDDEAREGPPDERPGEDSPGDRPADAQTGGGQRTGGGPNGQPASGQPAAGQPAGGPQGEVRQTKYCVECGASINAKAEICPECGVRQPNAPSSSDDDARIVAAVLAIVLGGFGAHKFYLGETGMGILYLCFFWTFIPSIVGIIEGAIYLSKSDEEFRAQYLE